MLLVRNADHGKSEFGAGHRILNHQQPEGGHAGTMCLTEFVDRVSVHLKQRNAKV